MKRDAETKHAPPGEVDDYPASERPRPLHTQADDEPPLSIREARVAGLTVDPDVVYGDTSADPNREDQIDAHRGAESE